MREGAVSLIAYLLTTYVRTSGPPPWPPRRVGPASESYLLSHSLCATLVSYEHVHAHMNIILAWPRVAAGRLFVRYTCAERAKRENREVGYIFNRNLAWTVRSVVSPPPCRGSCQGHQSGRRPIGCRHLQWEPSWESKNAHAQLVRQHHQQSRHSERLA